MQNLKSTLERKTKRHHPKLSDKKMTDQSYAKSCDINNIVKQFAKTNRLPESTKVAQYGDFSETPTLETAFKIAHVARDAFYQLPSDVRKLLENDPSKLESFIANPKNKQICLDNGLLELKKVPNKKDQVLEKSDDKSPKGGEKDADITDTKNSSTTENNSGNA